MADRIVSVDNTDYQLPTGVRETLATNIETPATPEHDAVLAVAESMTLPVASATVEGVVELATTAEATTGTDTTRAVTAAGVTAHINGAGIAKGKTGTKYKIVAACLRRVDATTWEALNDANHAPTGVTSVSIISSNRVRVTYDFTATKVVSWSNSLDETFASSTILIRHGASVGLTFAEIYFYTTAGGATPIDPGSLSSAGANVWVYGIFEVA